MLKIIDNRKTIISLNNKDISKYFALKNSMILNRNCNYLKSIINSSKSNKVSFNLMPLPPENKIYLNIFQYNSRSNIYNY